MYYHVNYSTLEAKMYRQPVAKNNINVQYKTTANLT